MFYFSGSLAQKELPYAPCALFWLVCLKNETPEHDVLVFWFLCLKVPCRKSHGLFGFSVSNHI